MVGMSVSTTRKSFPRTVAGLAAVSLLVPLAACTAAGPDEPSPSASGTQAGLERFYGQSPQWATCDDYANTATESAFFALVKAVQCARIEVPLDYADPTGTTIKLALIRHPARGEPIGSLVTNPGGPGGSGLTSVPTTVLEWTKAKSPLLDRFHLVSFDPRGVGATQPAVDCFSDKQADRGEVPLSTQGTTAEWTEHDTRTIVDRCAKGSGGTQSLAHLGTRDVARDLDILRAVLGDEKLSFLGQSYGTRVGAVYAEQFPRNIRAMLLDGAIDPSQGTFDRRVAAFAGFQAALERMAAACAKQDTCPLGKDPKNATTALQKLVQPLYDKPVPALTGALGFDAAIAGILGGLYTPIAWPRIFKGLTQIRQGRGDELLQISYDFDGRDANGKWTNFTEANFAINCMDEDRLTEQQGNELRAAIYQAAPFMDPGVKLTGARDACEHWPAQPTLGYPYATNIKGLPATLVVSMTGDPTTPHAGGISLAKTLGSTLLTVNGEGHTVVTAGANKCVNQAAAAYLIDLKLPAEGATCTQ